MEENLEAACHLIDDEAHRTRRPGGLDPPSSHEQPQSRPLLFFRPNSNQKELDLNSQQPLKLWHLCIV